jgi:hypothetical protein
MLSCGRCGADNAGSNALSTKLGFPLTQTVAAARFGDWRRNTAGVGFDPNRPYNAKPFDYALVGVCLAVAVGLLGWAFFG